MNRQELLARVTQFAHRCVKLALALPETPLGRHIRSQLIRCSTGAAANYRVACLAQSRAAFVAKLSIVVEEADESCFWMEFLSEESLLATKKIALLLGEGKELTSIFVSARRTTRSNSK
ncbi:MAG TPA: four helix bundle protein [Sedimentisphaerales bacterium]|jgi:four helix bundle protein|nr:four helix bundle protein [Sedimentisphaerales bacterium]HNU30789.1 four helix bundle protein [Sedimentisphaerales bacterium]